MLRRLAGGVSGRGFDRGPGRIWCLLASRPKTQDQLLPIDTGRIQVGVGSMPGRRVLAPEARARGSEPWFWILT